MATACVNASRGCPYEASAEGRECHNCKGAFYRWRKRRPAEIKARHVQLQLYDFRLAALLPDDEEKKRPPARYSPLRKRA